MRECTNLPLTIFSSLKAIENSYLSSIFELLILFFHLLGRYLYSKFDSLGNALQYAYPEFDWDLSKFSHRGKKAEQRSLRSKIEELLPGIEVIEEHQHSDCALGTSVVHWHTRCLTAGLIGIDGSQRPIEFDLWIPQHRIAIEYHGVM